jgi:DNA-directed RNA polymerase subunit RPC12/RpoP
MSAEPQGCPLGCPASYVPKAVIKSYVRGDGWRCPGCGGPVCVCKECESVLDTVAVNIDGACPECGTKRERMTPEVDKR